MRLYTIGFTKKPAERFFSLLTEHGVTTLVDIRLNPDGQLSGYAKRHDLAFFLDRIGKIGYFHLPLLAPERAILSDYRNSHDWPMYVQRFEALMDQRDIPAALDRAFFERQTCCLLCSEATPEQCHRRLVAERLAAAWPGLEVVHLV